MNPLQRHQLVWLDARAWQRMLAVSNETSEWDPQALECLQHWADGDLPLVVTRQPHGWSGQLAEEALVLGVAAPLCWGRRRLFDISAMLPPQVIDGWTALCIALQTLGAEIRVYGSHGWQQLTGLACVRDGSDIDLLVAIDSPRQADAAVALLKRVQFSALRLDVELVFGHGHGHGRAVARRESLESGRSAAGALGWSAPAPTGAPTHGDHVVDPVRCGLRHVPRVARRTATLCACS